MLWDFFVFKFEIKVMRKIVFLFLTLGLSSCYLFKENGIDYKIINNSNHSISNIVLKTSENTDSLVIELLKPEESKSGFLKMVNANKDGGLCIGIYNGKWGYV